MKTTLVLCLLTLLAGCATPKEPQLSLPPTTKVPEDLRAFALPVPVPLPAPVVQPVPVPPKPKAKNEVRYTWEEGQADVVPVGIGYPTLVKFEPGEVLTSVMDGDRAKVPEGEQAPPTPQGEAAKHCHYGERWQWCKGVSESQYTPVQHLVVTATHPNQQQGMVVLSDRRSYYLELQARAKTSTRLVSWTYPPPPPKPQPPRLFPDPASPHEYHVGYQLSLPDPAPHWTPIGVWSDTKLYVQFSPTVLYQRMPMVRGLDEQGAPFLVNSRQVGNWLIVDELAPRLELRLGADEGAQVVAISRTGLRTIQCPGAECPTWP